MEDELKELLAKQQISEVLYKYGAAIDLMDPELGQSVFHPGAICENEGMASGSAEKFIAAACQPYDQVLERHHLVGNILIELDGDKAVSDSCVTDAARLRGKDGALYTRQVWGRYHDEWEKRDGRWAIVMRKSKRVWEIRPCGAQETP